MALITCAECGREISDKAASCPACGAPADVFRAAGSEGQANCYGGGLQAAAHRDGRALCYDPSARSFWLAGLAMTLDQVVLLDRQKQLGWTRHDVRDVLHKAVQRGLPMGDLPVWNGPSKLEASFSALGTAAHALAPKSQAMVCPHCQGKGSVHTKQVRQKKGISGSKATAAVLTGGLSILATGLSRKENVTQAHCSACGNTWYL